MHLDDPQRGSDNFLASPIYTSEADELSSNSSYNANSVLNNSFASTLDSDDSHLGGLCYGDCDCPNLSTFFYSSFSDSSEIIQEIEDEYSRFGAPLASSTPEPGFEDGDNELQQNIMTTPTTSRNIVDVSPSLINAPLRPVHRRSMERRSIQNLNIFFESEAQNSQQQQDNVLPDSSTQDNVTAFSSSPLSSPTFARLIAPAASSTPVNIATGSADLPATDATITRPLESLPPFHTIIHGDGTQTLFRNDFDNVSNSDPHQELLLQEHQLAQHIRENLNRHGECQLTLEVHHPNQQEEQQQQELSVSQQRIFNSLADEVRIQQQMSLDFASQLADNGQQQDNEPSSVVIVDICPQSGSSADIFHQQQEQQYFNIPVISSLDRAVESAATQTEEEYHQQQSSSTQHTATSSAAARAEDETGDACVSDEMKRLVNIINQCFAPIRDDIHELVQAEKRRQQQQERCEYLESLLPDIEHRHLELLNSQADFQRQQQQQQQQQEQVDSFAQQQSQQHPEPSAAAVVPEGTECNDYTRLSSEIVSAADFDQQQSINQQRLEEHSVDQSQPEEHSVEQQPEENPVEQQQTEEHADEQQQPEEHAADQLQNHADNSDPEEADQSFQGFSPDVRAELDRIVSSHLLQFVQGGTLGVAVSSLLSRPVDSIHRRLKRGNFYLLLKRFGVCVCVCVCVCVLSNSKK